MFSSEQERRIGEAVRNVERLLQEISTTRKAREPVDVGYARVQIFEAPSGGTWENVSGDKWRLEGCTPVKRDVSGTWTNRSLAQTETIWFIPELFGEDDTPTPTGSNLPKWMVCFNDFATKRWFVLPSGSASSGDECDCCGMCGDTVSEWIDNFQTYQDGEDLTVYGYAATVPGDPLATNYSGALNGIWLGSTTHLDPVAIGRQFSIDCLKYSVFSFESKLFALDAFGLAEFTFNFVGTLGGPTIPIKIISAKVLTSTVQFLTMNGSATSVSHTFSANDIFKIEFEITSHDAVRTDGIAFEMEITTRGYINGTQVYTDTGTLNTTLENYCNAGYGVTESALGRGDTITDMWVFKAT